MVPLGMTVRCMRNGTRKRGHLILQAEGYVIELGEGAIVRSDIMYLYYSPGTQLKFWSVLESGGSPRLLF
jgi:hypothetical protein